MNFFLTAFYLDTSYTPNPMSRALPVLTLFEEGTLVIDKYAKWSNDKSLIIGHYYSDKAPLPTFLTVPFYGLLKLTGLHEAGPGKFKAYPVSVIGDIVCGVVPFVAMMVLTFLAVRNIPNLPVSAPLLATLPYYASFLVIYSGTFFNHIISSALLLGCYVLLRSKKRYSLAGTLLGAAVLCEYPVALAVPIFGAQVWINAGRRAFFEFVAGGIPWALAGVAYNWAITGSPFTTVNAFHADPSFAGMKQNYGFRLPYPEAFWGLTLSPFRGLFFYAPVLLLVAYSWLRRKEYKDYRKLMHHYLGPFSVLFFIAFTAHFTWWGGWCYGPRYLAPIATLLLYEGTVYLSRKGFSRRAFWALTTFGFVLAFIARTTELYMVPEKFKNPVIELLIPSVVAGKFNQGNLLTMIFGIPAWFAAGLWLAFFLLGMQWLSLKAAWSQKSS